jgi:hypothetical protein
MIQIPKIIQPDSGLTFRHPFWRTFYYEDGRTVVRSLRTTDIQTARDRRDVIYDGLVNQGATVRDGVRGRKLTGDGITPLKGFRIYVAGHKQRYAGTMEEAIAIRDEMLANPVKP